jgi:hypothetical protein
MSCPSNSSGRQVRISGTMFASVKITQLTVLS